MLALLSFSCAEAQERAKYDGKQAAAYARKWALKENSGYEKFDNDCTNFVSQSLLAGGWKQIDSSILDRKRDDVWWYGGTFAKASYTWGGAENLARFFKAKGRAEEVADAAKLGLGDVVQLKNREGKIYHTMIVTGENKGNLLLSYHTDNHLDEPLSKIQKRLPEGTVVLYWKVLHAD